MPRPLDVELLDRMPPADLDAEVAVLGSILLRADCLDDATLLIRPEDFCDDANGRLFEHLQAMHNAGGKIDVTLLVDRLRTAGDFETIGGTAYL